MSMKLPIERKPLLIIGGIILILLAMAPSFYFYNKYQTVKKMLQNPSKVTELENKAILEKVGKLIELPSGETPEIRTVTNVNDVKSQPFFEKAQNGDKVLVYSQAKKAVLYRPAINKIINFAPIYLPTNTPTPPPTNTTSVPQSTGTLPTPTPTQTTVTPTPQGQAPRFLLYNGTTKVGLTSKYETALKTAIPNAIVVDRDNAKKNDYPKTILVSIAGVKPEDVTKVSQILGIPIEKLPEGESVPPNQADLLIIVGADKLSL